MHNRRTKHESGAESCAANFSLASPEWRDDGLAANRNGCGCGNRRRRTFIRRGINLRTNFRPDHHTGSDHHTGIDSTRNQHARIDHDNSGHDPSSSRNRCSDAGHCKSDARYGESDARNRQSWIHHTPDFTDYPNPGNHADESHAGDNSEQSDSRDHSGHNHSRNH